MGLKGYRKVAGLTQAELAAAIGSTQSHVSEYENGARRLETMPAAQFLRLAEILDVDPRMLLTGEIPYMTMRSRQKAGSPAHAADTRGPRTRTMRAGCSPRSWCLPGFAARREDSPPRAHPITVAPHRRGSAHRRTTFTTAARTLSAKRSG